MVTLFNKSPRRRNTFIKKNAPAYRRETGLNARGKNSGWSPLKLDKRIAFIGFAFMLVGLIFTYSSSAFDSSAFFKRQLVFDLMGLAAALFLSQTYDKLQKLKIFRPMNLIYATWVLLIIVLFYRSAKEKQDRPFRFLWLAVVVSFACYIPVVLFADTVPAVAMLMLPETCAYVWAVLIGFNAMKGRNNG